MAARRHGIADDDKLHAVEHALAVEDPGANQPRLGAEPSSVESVRLVPELKAQLIRRAEDEGIPVSEVIREALREHLKAS